LASALNDSLGWWQVLKWVDKLGSVGFDRGKILAGAMVTEW